MTDTALTAIDPPSRRQAGRREASKPLRVTGRLKRTLDLMTWSPMTDSEACAQTGMRLPALRIALQRPHVRAYYRGQREVLREREGPANIRALVAVRDDTGNAMARVQAVKALESIGDTAADTAQRVQAPGIVIMIGASATVSNADR